MRLQDTKRSKVKPKEHQRPMNHKKGRPPTKPREFAKEGAYAVKARTFSLGVWGPWRWWGPNGILYDHWFRRSLLPMTEARSVMADLTHFGGQEAKIVTVWRKPS